MNLTVKIHMCTKQKKKKKPFMQTDKSFSHRKEQGILANLTLCHLLDTSMHA